jgi:polysaccharide export outer membrane protein
MRLHGLMRGSGTAFAHCRTMSRCLLLIAAAALTFAAGPASAQAQAQAPAQTQPPAAPPAGTTRPATAAPAPAAPATAAPKTATPTPAEPASSSPATAPRSAAAVPTTPPVRTASAANQPEYRIGAGDKLQINVYKEADLTQALQVRPDGRITMPLVGDFAAAGQTPMQLQRKLSDSLREYVTNPVVTVMVVEVADRVAYVMGEVNTPGAVPLKGPMTVVQALAVAGGFKDFANKGGIKVLRKTPGSDRVETIPFNYKDALRSDAPAFYLVEGDTVVVP